VAVLAACGETTGGRSPDAFVDLDAAVRDGGEAADAAPPAPALDVQFLGVAGFTFRVGDDVVLTAPLYSNPGLLQVGTGEIAPDADRIGRLLDTAAVASAKAILVGHAHYDHLLDVPPVRARTDDAVVIANDSARNLLASVVPEDRWIVVDDPSRPLVDRRLCPEPSPCTGVPAGAEGAWIPVPRSHVRVRALCSSHPPQILGGRHFGEGCVNERQAAPPLRAEEWREGGTVAFLVDFLDPATGAPRFRVYAQDAPTDAPLGHAPADVLAERRVDVAVLNVGSFDQVEDQPGAIIANLHPRYVLAGHWENFFRPQDEPIQPIPLMSPPTVFDERALAALPEPADAEARVDGAAQAGRYWRPTPGTKFSFPAP
jgi:L-ascorbate metabolism protein UlaG (beta-lactamase superfamily)